MVTFGTTEKLCRRLITPPSLHLPHISQHIPTLRTPNPNSRQSPQLLRLLPNHNHTLLRPMLYNLWSSHNVHCSFFIATLRTRKRNGDLVSLFLLGWSQPHPTLGTELHGISPFRSVSLLSRLLNLFFQSGQPRGYDMCYSQRFGNIASRRCTL